MAKDIVGVVVRRSADGRTAYVERVVRLPHSLYKKIVMRRKLYCVDVTGVACSVNDRVVIAPTRPVSKTKSWVLSRVV